MKKLFDDDYIAVAVSLYWPHDFQPPAVLWAVEPTVHIYYHHLLLPAPYLPLRLPGIGPL
jgi:hypothetical protein